MIECVPNFSEGRDLRKVEAIVEAIRATPGVLLLGWEADRDHNRAVVTFAGDPESVLAAAVQGAGKAAEWIDLRSHQGVHPRVGAADVIPFVPLEGSDLAECAAVAHRAGAAIWDKWRVPVFFYEAAARTPERRRLEKVRRKGFEQLLGDVASHIPDVGGARVHPTAGASCVGARDFLVAFNIDLETADAAVARAIAARIRESSGGFPFVKAMGLYLPSRGCAQVSMNLTRFREIPVEQVYEAVQAEAARLGTAIRGPELIGLIPNAAYEMAPEFYQRVRNFGPERIIERQIAGLRLYS
ncbi:MAG: glutamate formimidoyltransferase [Bryobacteraceae bacterium]|nr:glutamate formimidoyltransferase [Bryobacteraceae bacterium]